jgi:hypothetical protein
MFILNCLAPQTQTQEQLFPSSDGCATRSYDEDSLGYDRCLTRLGRFARADHDDGGTGGCSGSSPAPKPPYAVQNSTGGPCCLKRRRQQQQYQYFTIDGFHYVYVVTFYYSLRILQLLSRLLDTVQSACFRTYTLLREPSTPVNSLGSLKSRE